MKMKKNALRVVMLAAGVLLATGSANASADPYVTMAQKYVAQITQPSPKWMGPTTGPAAQKGKFVVFVSMDQRNGGALGVSEGVAQACKAIGWKLRVIDGQGTIAGRRQALSEAIAMKPDGIILGSVDAAEQAALIKQASNDGIKIVSWHSGPAPGKISGSPIFTNVSMDPVAIGRAAGLYAVANSGGNAHVVLFTDNLYKIATVKIDAAVAAIKKCKKCSVLAVENTPLGDVANRMPPLTNALLSKFGAKWNYSIGVNDLYFDFMAPSLRSAGIAGDGYPRNISAGDGSQAAFHRIRTNAYQIGTVAEPLYLDGWQCVDEMNRAFAGVPPSGFSYPVHLFDHSNVNADGGSQGVFDPNDGYQKAYEAIWRK